MTFVAAGQIARTSAAGNVAAPYTTYSPSLVEIAIILGALAFVAWSTRSPSGTSISTSPMSTRP
jgi:hypothetical protein